MKKKLGCGHPDGAANAAGFRGARHQLITFANYVRGVQGAAIRRSATAEAMVLAGVEREESGRGFMIIRIRRIRGREILKVISS